MKKSWVIIGTIIAVIGAAALYVTVSKNDASQTTAPPTQNPTDLPAVTPEPQEPTKEPAKPGTYQDYDQSAVANTSGRKILFFYAPWCPQCRALEQSIKAGTIPNDVTIFKTDFDSSTELRMKYGVNLQTTLVEIDSSGNKIQAYTAYNTPDLATVIKEMKL